MKTRFPVRFRAIGTETNRVAHHREPGWSGWVWSIELGVVAELKPKRQPNGCTLPVSAVSPPRRPTCPHGLARLASEHAAWTMIANALLNLDEVKTKQ